VAVLSLDLRPLADARIPIAISAKKQLQLAAQLRTEERCCGGAIVPDPKCTAPVRQRSSRRSIHCGQHPSTRIEHGLASPRAALLPRDVRGIVAVGLAAARLELPLCVSTRSCPDTSVSCSCLHTAFSLECVQVRLSSDCSIKVVHASLLLP
jgi:hypothetical protein